MIRRRLGRTEKGTLRPQYGIKDRHISLPRDFNISGVKNSPSCVPENVASSVYIAGTCCSSLNRVMRAVLCFDLCRPYLNMNVNEYLDISKEKYGFSFERMYGKILVDSGNSSDLQP